MAATIFPKESVPHSLDEFPIHQAPLSMAHVVSSDRNAYDRFYFNAHGRGAEPFLVAGIGVYPNLGVIDGYATVRSASASSPFGPPMPSTGTTGWPPWWDRCASR